MSLIINITFVLFILALQTKEVKDLSSFEEVFPVIRSSVMSKQYGNEDFLAELITKACRKYDVDWL